MPPSPSISVLTSKPESKSFLRTALTWQGSATPRVLPRVLVAAAYSIAIVELVRSCPVLSVEITPFEFCGIVLGLLLVVRVNSGLDRWWEARKSGAASSTKAATWPSSERATPMPIAPRPTNF